MDDEGLMHLFYDGLKEDVKNKLYKEDRPNTLDEFIAKAIYTLMTASTPASSRRRAITPRTREDTTSLTIKRSASLRAPRIGLT